ncbi:serine/threonine-protein kinase Nek4 isoform X1 [Hydra vulgaris]|uniref:serine/threonine-protein kinase Nek4 isoform X2 n=1 Tax=Hydra vulgaris TaxID=6087 RepID=UPI001F5EED65|nr:serine/threonine-protein kinase Nek4 isoform X1 [Hydra vulgaris]XP_047127056.1 serine/threonine-protein kinase Nek4 isoform X1 [Hydra vulgaris]
MSIENYIIGKLIGKGSYGEVNLAQSKVDKKWYVIKSIDLRNASKKERLFAQQEVDILSKLYHPNIVSYKESFQFDNGCLAIVMVYCEGGDLYTRLREQAKLGQYLSETQVVEWFIQIAMALQYMHNENILHRDLKTQNIFLSKTKIIKLGDLGIARVLENNFDMATTMIGTPYYMSPELFSNKPYNTKSDIWALGCCVYEMITLKHAFNASDMNSLVYKILKGKLPSMPQHYSQDLQEIIKTMLMHNPTSRPSAARLLRHPYIKSHIVLFLEGAKNRRRSCETKSKNDEGASDSGFSEGDLKNVVTSSNIEIQIVNDKILIDKLDNSNDKVQEVSFDNRLSFKKNINFQVPKVIELSCEDKSKKLKQVKVDSNRNFESTKNYIKPEESANSNQKSDKDSLNSKPFKLQQNNERKLCVNNSSEVRKVITDRLKLKLHQRDEIQKNIKKSNQNEKKNDIIQPQHKGPQSEEYQHKGLHEEKEKRSSRPLPPRPCVNQPLEEYPVAISCSRSNEDTSGSKDIQACGPNFEARKKRRQRQQESMTPFVSDIWQVPKKNLPVASKVKVNCLRDVVDGAVKRVDVNQNQYVSLQTKEPLGKSVEEAFIESLQQTLKMESDINDRISPEQPPCDEIITDCPTVTGRLFERIAMLKRQCVSILGDKLLQEAYNVIDINNEEQVENALISLIGEVKYNQIGGQICQLKFYEQYNTNLY